MAVAPVATSSNSNQQQQQQSQQPQRQQPQQQYGRLPRRFARALTTAAAGPGARPPAGGAATKAPAPSSTTTAPAADGPWLIVGLGNPGPRYERTRHNVGFMVVDALARSEGIDMRKLEKGAAVGRGEVAGKRVLLAKPATFMVRCQRGGWGVGFARGQRGPALLCDLAPTAHARIYVPCRPANTTANKH